MFNGEPFGQLQTLKMVVDDSQHDTLRLLTVPSLTSISLSCYNLPEDSLSWVAYCMPDMAPNITHLEISLGWTQNLEISRHSALKHLELRSGDVKPHFWQSLAACPLLMTIVLTACTDVLEWEEGLGWRVGLVYFPALRTLRIQYGHPKVLLTLILRSRMPMLECVGWDEYSRPDEDDVDLLAAQLEQYSPMLDTDTLYQKDTAPHSDTTGDGDADSW